LFALVIKVERAPVCVLQDFFKIKESWKNVVKIVQYFS